MWDRPMNIPVLKNLQPELVKSLGILGTLEYPPTRDKKLQLLPGLPTSAGVFQRHTQARRAG